MSEHVSGNPGPATDAQNSPVLDPSPNVLDLVEAAIKRQDDLRQAEKEHVIEVLRLRGEQRVHDFENVREISELRAGHARELREAEAARIDAIRAVDVGAVNRAAEVAAAQAATLAATVTSSADALRAQVATTAAAFDAKLTLALDPIQKRIDDLSRAQYEALGQKAQVTESRSSTGAVVAYIVGGVGALVAVATLLIVLLSNPPA